MTENDILAALIVAFTAVRLTVVTLSHRRLQRAAADKKAAGR